MHLSELKSKAQAAEKDEPVWFDVTTDGVFWRFLVKPHGNTGYAWILTGPEVALRIGNWISPKQRPSAMVEIRSETLWRFGAVGAIQRVERLLARMGAHVEALKPSRLDLCVDLLIPSAFWGEGIRRHCVTRARNIGSYESARRFSGLTIGKGKVSARIYDKSLEIAERSQKTWMFDVWGIEDVDESERVIRVEFQLRRETLKAQGFEDWDSLHHALPEVWAYCTKSWLRLTDNPRLHHTQQTVLPFWSIVQSGFAGAQDAEPRVREVAISRDRQRIAAQVLGGVTSMAALWFEHDEDLSRSQLDVTSVCRAAVDECIRIVEPQAEEFTKRVERKRSKYCRSSERVDRSLDSKADDQREEA
ncbi:MAG: hypothetical protein AAF196_07290 [Planctomycetota bacterium]